MPRSRGSRTFSKSYSMSLESVHFLSALSQHKIILERLSEQVVSFPGRPTGGQISISHRGNNLDLAWLAALHHLAWIPQHAVLDLAYVDQPLVTFPIWQRWKPFQLHEASEIHDLTDAAVVDAVKLGLLRLLRC